MAIGYDLSRLGPQAQGMFSGGMAKAGQGLGYWARGARRKEAQENLINKHFAGPKTRALSELNKIKEGKPPADVVQAVAASGLPATEVPEWNEWFAKKQALTDQIAGYDTKAAEYGALMDVNERTALGLMYPNASGGGAGGGRMTDFQRKQLAKENPEALEAYERFERGLSAFQPAYNTENEQAANQAMMDMELGRARYEHLTGSSLGAASLSAMSVAAGKMEELKLKRLAQAGRKSEEGQKMLTDMKGFAKDWIDSKKAARETLKKLKVTISAINRIASESNLNTAQKRATAVKLLAQVIEPGLAVTSGEVEMYSGSGLVKAAAEEVNSVWSGLKSAYNKVTGVTKSADGTRFEVAKDLARVNAAETREVINLAQKLSNVMGAKWAELAGTQEQVDTYINDVVGKVPQFYKLVPQADRDESIKIFRNMLSSFSPTFEPSEVVEEPIPDGASATETTPRIRPKPTVRTGLSDYDETEEQGEVAIEPGATAPAPQYQGVPPGGF